MKIPIFKKNSRFAKKKAKKKDLCIYISQLYNTI